MDIEERIVACNGVSKCFNCGSFLSKTKNIGVCRKCGSEDKGNKLDINNDSENENISSSNDETDSFLNFFALSVVAVTAVIFGF